MEDNMVKIIIGAIASVIGNVMLLWGLIAEIF